jgi:hypothetical protein
MVDQLLLCCTVAGMNRRRTLFAIIVVTLLATVVGLNRGETEMAQPAAQPYPKVLAELRPERWPERFPTLTNVAVVEQHLDGELSWVFVSPGDYVTNAVEIFDAFVAAGYPGTRLISLSDSTFLGASKSEDVVAIRLDQLAHPKAPDRWTIIRITYVEPPQQVDRAELEKLA